MEFVWQLSDLSDVIVSHFRLLCVVQCFNLFCDCWLHWCCWIGPFREFTHFHILKAEKEKERKNVSQTDVMWWWIRVGNVNSISRSYCKMSSHRIVVYLHVVVLTNEFTFINGLGCLRPNHLVKFLCVRVAWQWCRFMWPKLYLTLFYEV